MTWLLALLLGWAGLTDERPGGRAVGANVTIPIGDAGGGQPLPAVTPARGANPPLVVIDAGHGGRDPGAPAAVSGIAEKDVTLGLAISLRDELARSGRVRAALTRTDDRFIPLEERYAIARRLGASLFISLHADAAPTNETVRGATVYTLSEVASDREAALLAQRENAADATGTSNGDPNVNLILIDLAQRESMDVSARFARTFHREASSSLRFQADWHRFAAFIVLKAPDIPSVLFEAGYVTNREDVLYLTSPGGRSEIAIGLRRGIEAHFARRFLPAGRS